MAIRGRHPRWSRADAEAAANIVPAMTRGVHEVAAQNRDRPITDEPIGGFLEAMSSTFARRRANVLIEGQERSGMAPGVRTWNRAQN